MSNRNDDIRKCPICNVYRQSKNPCNHLLLVLKYTEDFDYAEFYDDDDLYYEDPDMVTKYADCESSASFTLTDFFDCSRFTIIKEV